VKKDKKNKAMKKGRKKTEASSEDDSNRGDEEVWIDFSEAEAEQNDVDPWDYEHSEEEDSDEERARSNKVTAIRRLVENKGFWVD
jgi:hypothetical protein